MKFTKLPACFFSVVCWVLLVFATARISFAFADPFDANTATQLMDALRHNLEIGDAEAAERGAILLGLALRAHVLSDPAGREAAEASTLRSSFSSIAASKFREVLPNDPTATGSLLYLASKMQGALAAGEYGNAYKTDGEILNSLRPSIAQRIHEKLTTDFNTPGIRDPAVNNYFRLSLQLWDSLRTGDLATAEALAPQVLQQANSFADLPPTNGSRGFAAVNLFNAYDALGRASLSRNDFESAQKCLLLAADVPGSNTRLSTPGPNLWLAKALLDKGYNETVLEFLEKIRTFYLSPKVELWIQQIRQGKSPSLSPNSSPSY